MLGLRDLLDYCDLDEGEIEAIAEHEHVPLAIAAEMSASLLSTPEGVFRLHSMLVENMAKALRNGEFQRLEKLEHTYQHLRRTHPLPSSMSA